MAVSQLWKYIGLLPCLQYQIFFNIVNEDVKFSHSFVDAFFLELRKKKKENDFCKNIRRSCWIRPISYWIQCSVSFSPRYLVQRTELSLVIRNELSLKMEVSFSHHDLKLLMEVSFWVCQIPFQNCYTTTTPGLVSSPSYFCTPQKRTSFAWPLPIDIIGHSWVLVQWINERIFF